jgi:tetratricopeptide (TPR) repeat protein
MMADQRWWSILVILAVPAVGAVDEPWVGQTVFVKRAGVTFGYVENERWVNAGEIAELSMPVLAQRGDWLLVRSNGKRGWVPMGEVVPLANAAAYFTQQIQAEPRNASHILRRAAAWVEHGEYEKAANDCSQAIRFEPANAVAYYCRALARHLGRQYDRALSDYSAAILLAPDNASAYAGRAWLRATCPDTRYRDGAGAVRDALQACELSGWTDPNCLDNLAAAYAENGQFDYALKWQEKALELPGLRNSHRENAQSRVKLYRASKPYRTAGRN